MIQVAKGRVTLVADSAPELDAHLRLLEKVLHDMGAKTERGYPNRYSKNSLSAGRIFQTLHINRS